VTHHTLLVLSRWWWDYPYPDTRIDAVFVAVVEVGLWLLSLKTSVQFSIPLSLLESASLEE
jgi:hypothetical protein